MALAQSPSSGSGDPGKLVQCWTDDSGRRICGDRVPPSDARREREFYDRRGVVKRIVPAERTPEQIAADERARKDAEAKATFDRYLIQTYNSPAEIERTRDDRLATLDGRKQMAEKNLADISAALDDLRKRGVDPDDPGSSPALKNQIANFEQARKDNLASLASIKAERDKTVSQFDQELTRFRELRAGAPQANN